jgi:putative transposase
VPPTRSYRACVGRPDRIQRSGATYHVNTVGAGGIAVFRDSDDRLRFLRILRHVVERSLLRCHSYCLMTTHYHLAATTPEPTIAAAMHVLNGLYAQTFNRRHERRGHLFGARYFATLVESETHARHVCAYIPRNPVRARLCVSPERWYWSSYGATIGLRQQVSFVDDGWVLDRFGRDPRVAQERFREYVTLAALEELGKPVEVPGTLEGGRGSRPSVRA